MGIVGSMAQAQPNPQVHSMCANIAAKLYPLGIQTMPNVQAAHEEIQQITTTLGDVNHGVKRNDFRFPGSAQRFRVLVQDGCPVCQAQGFDFRPGPRCGSQSHVST